MSAPAPLPRRPLGRSGLEVPALGLGGGPLGGPGLPEVDADRLLRTAVDAGVTLIDTAPSYGDSELRIGGVLARGLRERVVLSTKLGYGVPGVPDWTGPCIRAGVERSLRRLRCDRLDIAHLHSCPLEVLEGSGVVDALLEEVAAGRVGVAAYSGDGDGLAWAVASKAFGCVQLSLNPWDQAALDAALPTCRDRGIGVIGKRSLANAVWAGATRPETPDLAEYRRRFRTLAIDHEGFGWADLSLRFAAFQPGISSCLVGTRRPERVLEAVAAIARGALPPELERRVRAAWRRDAAGWRGVV